VNAYVLGAYAVFAAALAWDAVVPRLRLHRAWRAIRGRAQREAARTPATAATP
jgi:hypothetical protein